jgi:hypothetical protein
MAGSLPATIVRHQTRPLMQISVRPVALPTMNAQLEQRRRMCATRKVAVREATRPMAIRRMMTAINPPMPVPKRRRITLNRPQPFLIVDELPITS